MGYENCPGQLCYCYLEKRYPLIYHQIRCGLDLLNIKKIFILNAEPEYLKCFNESIQSL